MPQEFQRGQQQNDVSIQSYNFGGLNTTASRLNVPYNDATVLTNVNVNIAGALIKRRGTDDLQGGSNASTTIRTTLGYPFVITKVGATVEVSARINSRLEVLVTLFGVFKATSTNTRPLWVQLPDTYPRLLVLHPDNVPTEVYTVEQRQTFAAVPTTTYVINNAKRFSGVVGPTAGLYRDVVIVTNGGVQTRYSSGVNASYNSATEQMTVTLPTVPSGSSTSTRVDIVGFRWCWWAESVEWRGDRFYDSVSRFNVTATDNTVAIPATLRSDVNFGVDPLFLSMFRTSNRASAYPLVTQPTTADNWNTSDGSVYAPGADKYVNSSPFFVTFGLARTPFPQPAEFLGISRSRELRFNGNTSITSNNLRVTVSGTVVNPWFSGVNSPTPNSYYLFGPPLAAPTFVSNTTSPAIALEFTASLPIGLAPAAQVVMTNIERLHTGVSATQLEVESSLFSQGAYRSVPGIGLFCDYRLGVFPTCGAVYQGRLALSGVASDKSRVVISGVNPADNRYQYFQITDDLDGVASDPFDIIASGGDADDYVTGLVEWNSSLFALTRRSVYRVHGGDQPLSAARRYVTYISNIGLVNAQSLVRTDTAVYYLSDGGVFNLTPKIEDSEYTALEKTLKIRDAFLAIDPTKLTNSTMFFDNKFRRLYVAVPRADDTSGASLLFVMDTTREAWSKYDTIGGFEVTGLYPCIDFVTGAINTAACNPTTSLMFDSEYYMDRCRSTINGAPFYTLGFAVPTVLGNNKYRIPLKLPVPHFTGVKSVRLFTSELLSGIPVELTAYTQQGEYVYLDESLPSGRLLWFMADSPINDTPQGIVRYGAGNLYPASSINNNVTLLGTTATDYFYTSGVISVTFFQPPGRDVTKPTTFGIHYYTEYTSPLFTQQALGSYKRTKHAYLYFNNGPDELYTNSYTVTEAYTTRVNANVAIMYDSDDESAEISADIYGFQDIVWDNALFDTNEASTRLQEYSLFKEALIGIGYAYRLSVWSYDEARWNLVGYQVDTKQKGMRYI